MVLGPVESHPVLMMRFRAGASPDLITCVKERLQVGGIRTITQEDAPSGEVILGLATTQEELEAEAESVHLMKFTHDTHIMAVFTVESRSQFLHVDDEDIRITEKDSHGLFTLSDRALLVWSMLDDIQVLEQGSISCNLSRKLDQLKIPFRKNSNPRKSWTTSKRFGFVEQPLSPGDNDDGNNIKTEGLRHVLEGSGLVDLVTPVHVPHMRDKLLHNTLNRKVIIPPIESISDYYGEEVAYYFAWLDHFTKWLCFPGLLAILCYAQRTYRNDTIDTDEYTPYYGLITFVWGMLFMRSWERTECRLAYQWGTFSSSGFERKYFNVRPEFHGELIVSPVTGHLEKHYPAYKRYLKYLVSALVTVSMLSIAFSVMIMSLNLQGYIRPMNDPTRWNDEHQHPFHYPILSVLAEKGNLFDVASQWMCFVPVVVHVMCMMTMNAAYRHVATRLTEWENHETENDHRNSIILKRFMFEAFDAYIALFYLAFYERNVDRLRAELVSVFNIDTFRRMLVECILPWVMQRMSGGQKHNSAAENKKTDGTTGTQNKAYQPLTEESKRDPYEQFDDYLEMVIELGYVTLFASAYPLASVIAIIANYVEIRMDFFKLTKVCLRPRSIRTDSALTNCLLFGFTSRQLMEYLPGFFFEDEMGHKRMVPGKGWIVVFIIFGLERFLLYVGLIIHQLVPSVPEDVVFQMERRQHIMTMAAQKSRATEALKKQRTSFSMTIESTK
eukprot:scaffold1386_cov55-Attheya_sp.AAC.3